MYTYLKVTGVLLHMPLFNEFYLITLYLNKIGMSILVTDILTSTTSLSSSVLSFIKIFCVY